MQYASNEFGCIEQGIMKSWCVQFRIIDAVLVWYILFENAQRQYRQWRIEKIVHRYVHRIEHRLLIEFMVNFKVLRRVWQDIYNTCALKPQNMPYQKWHNVKAKFL